MASKEILYVAHGGDDLNDGLSYAMYLAKTMGTDLQVMVINSRTASERFDDAMTAVTFAEHGERESAIEALDGGVPTPVDETAAQYATVRDRCRAEGITVRILTGPANTVSAVSQVVSPKSRFEMVLLSPGLTKRRSVRNSLLDVLPRPVVTMMADHAGVAG